MKQIDSLLRKQKLLLLSELFYYKLIHFENRLLFSAAYGYRIKIVIQFEYY